MFCVCYWFLSVGNVGGIDNGGVIGWGVVSSWFVGGLGEVGLGGSWGINRNVGFCWVVEVDCWCRNVMFVGV